MKIDNSEKNPNSSKTKKMKQQHNGYKKILQSYHSITPFRQDIID